nr:putative reverse transcriptase domain-containing protein [Tanacetum cinerariifolium]
MQKAGTLTDEAIRNGSLKKNTEKRGNGGEPSRDRNLYRLGHLAKDYRVVPRMVNLVNARNPTAACRACFECGGTNPFKAACARLNQPQRPRGGIESSNLGLVYEIKIASGQLVEINKEWTGCPNTWLRSFSMRRSAKTKEQKKEDIVMVRNFPEFLGHVINGDGIHVDPSKIEVVKNWESPKTPSEVRSLLGFVGKVNIGADALSRKEQIKPRRIRAMNMTLQSNIKDKILAFQKEAFDESVGLQRGLDELIERRSDRALYYLDRIWVLLKGDVRTLIMDEAYKLKYSIHQGDDKMYYDLRDMYWRPGMKMDIAVSYHSSVRCAPFEALHGRKCRSSITWAEVGEGKVIGPEIVQETTEKISQIKDRLKAACDHKKAMPIERGKL